MAHFDLFRAQIERIVLLRRDLDRDALLDLDAEAVQTVDLFRIVGQQTQLLCAEVLQDLRADPVFAQVGREAELDVRLDRVEALLLKLVGLDPQRCSP